MHQIVLKGSVGPQDSFSLHQRLEPLTSALRPAVTVDLSAVEGLHPSVASVLIRQHRQARRQGGAVDVIAPASPGAAEVLSHIGLIGTRA